MAKVRGFTCDVCDVFEPADNGSDAMPIGWLTLQVHTAEHDHTGNDNRFDICGNACLKKLARERAGETKKVNKGSGKRGGEQRLGTDGKKYSAQSHSRWHTNRNEVNLDCPFCVDEAETQEKELSNA